MDVHHHELADLVAALYGVWDPAVVVELDADGSGVAHINDAIACDVVLYVQAAFAFEHPGCQRRQLDVYAGIKRSGTVRRY